MPSRRIRLLLTQAPGEASIAEAIAGLRDQTSALPDFVWGTKIDGDPIAGTAHRQEIGEPSIGADVFVETGGEGLAGLERLIWALGTAVDHAASCAIAGVHHLLMARTGPCMAIFALAPREDMSREAFFNYWFNVHGKFFVEAQAGAGSYYQLHADAEQTRAINERLGLDGPQFAGHAGGWMKNPERIREAFQHPTALEALADERNFIDHSRSLYGVYRLAG